ncbi:MAG: T9SS type A sorting domain-containing protein [Flavobacteriales bacterium]
MNSSRFIFLTSAFVLVLTYSNLLCQTASITKIPVSGDQKSSQFGLSIAIDGDYAAFGAPSDGVSGVDNSGAVYIFHYDANTGLWSETQHLVGANSAEFDNFGRSIDMEGGLLLIGAPGKEVNNTSNEPQEDAGIVYMYELNASTGMYEWVESLRAIDRSAYDDFGTAVSISDSIIVVGAPGEDHLPGSGGLISNSGSAYIFEYDQSQGWYTAQKIKASDPGEMDHFGSSVDNEGQTVIVGSLWEGNQTSEDVSEAYGALYAFKQDSPGFWSFTQKIVANPRSDERWFGARVSLSDDQLLASCLHSNHAKAVMFTRNSSGTWIQQQKMYANHSDDYFGNDVHVDGTDAFAAAHELISFSELESWLYWYKYDGVDWVRTDSVAVHDGVRFQVFWGIAASDEFIAIGWQNNYEDSLSNAGTACFVSRQCLGEMPVVWYDSNAQVGTSTNYTSYQWTLNGQNIQGSNSATHQVTEDGVYRVIVTGSNGCVYESLPIFYNLLGTNTPREPEFSVFPNPFVKEISLEGLDENASWILFDIQGRFLQEGTESHIQLGNYPAGEYTLVIEDGGNHYAWKLIKAK